MKEIRNLVLGLFSTRLEVGVEEQVEIEGCRSGVQYLQRRAELIRIQKLQVVDKMKRVIPDSSSFIVVLEMESKRMRSERFL